MMVKQSFYYIGLELCVRVREGQDNDFIEKLKADSESQFPHRQYLHFGDTFFQGYSSQLPAGMDQ